MYASRIRSMSGSEHPVVDTIHPPATTPRTLLVEKHGKPHHPFPRALAPYPVNYEKAVLDADALDLAFRLQIFEGSPTSIPDIKLDSPKTHPRRCLDLGCSSGDWIIAASRSWPNATFVGVDLVIGHQIPVHFLEQSDHPPHDPLNSAAAPANAVNAVNFTIPDSQTQSLRARSSTGTGNSVQPYSATSPTSASSSPPLGARIRWVQANFLKPLPFGDGEFDYIHISGIARGVPEDKWDSLFAEVSRVLAVNGHLEMLDEDVIFPILTSDHRAATTAPFDSGRNGSIAGLSETTSTSRTSVSSYMFFDSNVPSDEKARRNSFNANRFLAAAAPKPPRPLVPSLRLNTKLSDQSYSGDSPATTATTSTRSAEFPFVSPTPQHRNADGSSTGVPKKRSADPAIPRGWDGPSQVKRCMDPAIPTGWDGPSQVKRCMDPAIPTGWDGPPEAMSIGNSFLPGSKKDGKGPRAASAVASSLIALSSKTPSLPFNSRSRRPTLAGQGPGRSKSKGPSDGAPPSSYPVPPLPNSIGASRADSSSLGRHVRDGSLTMPDAPPSMSSIKHDHQVLQTLFFGVYEGRFINTTPTAILPSLFNMYFQNVKFTPPIDFPTPPPPHAARENTRRDRRNTMQREWGSAGLEQSRGVAMNVSRSFTSLGAGDGHKGVLGQVVAPHVGTTNNRVDVSPLTVDRSLKRVQSSPGLALDARNLSSSRLSSPFSATSTSSGRSESSLSRNTSFLPTPVSLQQGNPHIESPRDVTQHAYRHGAADTGLVSPDSTHQLHHSKSSVSVERAPAEEEEDAKLAIMGDGGFFPTEEDPATATPEVKDGRTLSEFPSLASLRSERSIPRNDEVWSQPEKEEDFLLDVLQDFEIGADEDDHFDHLAAEELEIFDIVGRVDEPPSASAEISKRIYVRPRKAFAGHGMPVPSQLLEMDDLSMGVHLMRAWLNVVACKEAMWDELQRRAQTVQSLTKETYSPDNEPGSQRMTLLDEVEWVGSEQRMSSREKFELLFLRFEDDMRQWAAVGSAIPQKLSWIDPRYPNLGPVPLLSSKRTHGAIGLDDGCGPGKDGIIIPGVDVCRTLRVFTARKSVDRHSPGGNASKILGVL